MKVVILCKQSPMHRDLLTRPYGRFFYLSKYLAEFGHDVSCLLLNYKKEAIKTSIQNGVSWISISIHDRLGLTYYKEANTHIKNIRPDWIIGFSDIYFGILAVKLAKKHNCLALIDAYDNYESYIPWLKPLHWLWRFYLSKADLVTAAGPGLAELMGKQRSDRPTAVIPMAADPGFCTLLNKTACRKKLDLPMDRKIIGYCGGIHKNRGIEQLFSAFEIVRKTRPDIEFVLSGRLFAGIKLPKYIRWLGYIDDELLPCLIKSLDTLVAVNLNSAFGNYSYPVKIYEAIQSGTPVVAIDTPATNWILSDHRDLLAPSNNIPQLADKILQAITLEHVKYEHIGSWQEHATTLEMQLLKLSSLKK